MIRGCGGMISLLLYIVFGLYFLNKPFEFVEMPEFVMGFDIWITFVGGILIILGGINHMMASRRMHHQY